MLFRSAEEAVAVLYRDVTEIDGVARAVEQAVLKNIDGIVVLRTLNEGVGMHLTDGLSSRMHASAPDEGAEGDKRKDE